MKKYEWTEDILSSRYNAVRMSSKDLKPNELAINLQPLSNKPSSLFNNSMIFNNPGRQELFSSYSKNSHESKTEIEDNLNQTQIDKGDSVRYLPMFQNFNSKNLQNESLLFHKRNEKLNWKRRGNTNVRSAMKQMIKAATSRFHS